MELKRTPQVFKIDLRGLHVKAGKIMFSLSMNFDMDGTDILGEQLAYLRNLYMDLKNDFVHDRFLEEQENIPQFTLCIKAEVRKTVNGSKVNIEVKNRASIIKELNKRKDKIDELLKGIDELTLIASKIETELNGVNSNADLQYLGRNGD